ncbi:trigger factor, partial [Streptomyces althioticus]|uniref:trigger factor n=1 Tax=Streptomyces althioticus TaxID=83380 RepID=UPI0033F051F6
STTLTSTGAVDSFHSSFTGLGGGITLLGMMLGEIAPGGVGSGLYGMLVMAVIAVFIAGLMVGRTPEYLGKKIGTREIKQAALYILVTPALVLVLTAAAMALPTPGHSMTNSGAHATPVERAAEDGDVVTIDLEAKVDGEVLEDGVASGVSYTIGSGELLDGIDDAVKGLEAGGEATFTSELKGGSAAGKEAEVTVKVTQVAKRELPELDDDFAQLASEFDTLEELKADSRKRLENMKQYDQATQAQERVLDKLLELVEVPVPEKLLEDEINTRKHNLEHHQLGQMGLDLAKYLEIQGKSEEEFDAETKEAAVKGIKTQFVLDELVKQEKLNVNQEELTEHLMRRAASSGMSPDQFAQAVVEQGQVPLLVGEVARGKALAVVVEKATVKDTNGETVDLEDDEDEAAEAETSEAAADEKAEEKTEG